MNNKAAFILGGIIMAGLGLDFAAYDFQATLFLARKLVDLIDWMAFWR